MQQKRYILVKTDGDQKPGVYPATKLGLQHPAVMEHYHTEGLPILMYDRGLNGTPPYYFIVPLYKEEFSEIRGTEWDSVTEALERIYSGNLEPVRRQWESLENFDEHFVKGGNIEYLSVERYRRAYILGIPTNVPQAN